MNQPISKECQHIFAHIFAFFQNDERVPISPKGEEPKPWEGPYFPISPILVAHDVKTWATKIGEIGK